MDEIDRKIADAIKPLTPDDFKHIKQVLEEHGRVRWLLSSIKNWIIAATAVITFLTIGLDGIKKILRGLIA